MTFRLLIYPRRELIIPGLRRRVCRLVLLGMVLAQQRMHLPLIRIINHHSWRPILFPSPSLIIITLPINPPPLRQSLLQRHLHPAPKQMHKTQHGWQPSEDSQVLPEPPVLHVLTKRTPVRLLHHLPGIQEIRCINHESNQSSHARQRLRHLPQHPPKYEASFFFGRPMRLHPRMMKHGPEKRQAESTEPHRNEMELLHVEGIPPYRGNPPAPYTAGQFSSRSMHAGYRSVRSEHDNSQDRNNNDASGRVGTFLVVRPVGRGEHHYRRRAELG